MNWEKNLCGNHKTFSYSSETLCKECSGYNQCENENPCHLIEIEKFPTNLGIFLKSKERYSRHRISEIEIVHSNVTSKAKCELIDNLEGIPISPPKDLESKKISEFLFKIMQESIPQEFFNIRYRGSGSEELNYGFFEKPQLPSFLFSNFLSILEKLPIVKVDNHPTHDDLGFPFRFVTEEEFPEIYGCFYNIVSNLVINNRRV